MPDSSALIPLLAATAPIVESRREADLIPASMMLFLGVVALLIVLLALAIWIFALGRRQRSREVEREKNASASLDTDAWRIAGERAKVIDDGSTGPIPKEPRGDGRDGDQSA